MDDEYTNASNCEEYVILLLSPSNQVPILNNMCSFFCRRTGMQMGPRARLVKVRPPLKLILGLKTTPRSLGLIELLSLSVLEHNNMWN